MDFYTVADFLRQKKSFLFFAFLLFVTAAFIWMGGYSGRLLSVFNYEAISAGCDTSYATDEFRVCYFDGINPSSTGDAIYLGSTSDGYVASPAPTAYQPIEHLWGSGIIFGDQADTVSGVWRGRINFPVGRYQLTVQADDGVRVYVNENLVIDEWRDQVASYAAGMDLDGYADIRIEWYDNGWDAKLRFRWDKVSILASQAVVPAKVDFYILPEVNTCIVGNVAATDRRFNVFNADGSIFKSFEIDSTLRSLKPSDPSIPSYPQSACFSFGISPAEQIRIQENVAKAFQVVRQRHTLGLFDASVRTITLNPAEVALARWGDGFWLDPVALQPLVNSYLTEQTDFVIATNGYNEFRDGVYGKYIGPPACGGTYGADLGVGGAGYSWVPQTEPGMWYECSTSGVYLNEWLHQLEWAIPNLMGLNDIYVDDATGARTYPPCGQGDPDTYKWFPGNYELLVDPDSPWCGDPWGGHPGADVGDAHLFLDHFDFSMSHYSYPAFYGNHCRNGVKDFSETSIDKGGRCPAQEAVVTTYNWTTPTQFDAASNTFTAIPDATSVTITNNGGNGYVRAKRGRNVIAYMDVYNPSLAAWVNVWSRPISSSSFYFNGLTVAFPRQSVSGMRFRVSQTQKFAYNDWGGMLFTFSQ